MYGGICMQIDEKTKRLKAIKKRYVLMPTRCDCCGKEYIRKKCGQLSAIAGTCTVSLNIVKNGITAMSVCILKKKFYTEQTLMIVFLEFMVQMNIIFPKRDSSSSEAIRNNGITIRKQLEKSQSIKVAYYIYYRGHFH